MYYLKSHNTFKPLQIFVYEGMGIGFISLTVVCLGITFNFLTNIKELNIGITCLISILLISILGLIKGRKLLVKNIQLSSSKIKKEHNFIFITDIHLGTNKMNHLLNILKKIKNIKYDFILIGGVLIDSSSFDLKNLNILKSINKDIYFVNGNHEYYLKDFKKKIDSLHKCNIKVLKNQSIIIEDINLIGVDDLQSIDSKINYVKSLRKENLFNLVLTHKPDVWDKIKDQNELMLSGHTHNGQIFPFNLIVKLKFKYIYGLYKMANSNLYVSSGAGCWGPKIRIGTSNEIINFKLTNNN
jgi:predicted MPP superfamily phosphohydrolase